MRDGIPAALRKTIRITARADDLGRFIFGRIGLLVFDEGAVGVRSSLATERALSGPLIGVFAGHLAFQNGLRHVLVVVWRQVERLQD